MMMVLMFVPQTSHDSITVVGLTPLPNGVQPEVSILQTQRVYEMTAEGYFVIG